nr:HAD-IIA family hydrolase [Glycomyces xiaoerkulensis]
MDGVLVHEGVPVPGANKLIEKLQSAGKRFLVLTNNSIYTPRDLHMRLKNSGLTVPAGSIYTSAMATADFLQSQRPEGSAYVIGEAGLTTALHEIDYVLTDTKPDYVVLGETRRYDFGAITTAVRLIKAGSRFICTNPDATGPSLEGILPAAGAVAAMISEATGADPYFVGKPNPLMMRNALRRIEAHSESTVMIGDRMDTDVLSGLEAGLETVLVMSGVTDSMETVEKYPFRPNHVKDSVADLIDWIELGADHVPRTHPGPGPVAHARGGRRVRACTEAGRRTIGLRRRTARAGAEADEPGAADPGLRVPVVAGLGGQDAGDRRRVGADAGAVLPAPGAADRPSGGGRRAAGGHPAAPSSPCGAVEALRRHIIRAQFGTNPALRNALAIAPYPQPCLMHTHS